jgi:hypothetical protein
MIKYFTSILIVLCASALQAQQKINIKLKKELDSIYKLDQMHRGFFYHNTNLDSLAEIYHIPKSGVLEYINRKMAETDSSNIRRIEAIIKEYGYPGKTLVDTPANEAVFYVIQHSNKIATYLPLIEKATKEKELLFKLYAMMLDRQLMNEGKEQIYGTQGRTMSFTVNSQTGERNAKGFIWPIKDPQHVNERRKKAGFDLTVEANAQRLGIEYKVLTLEEAKKMQSGS